MTVEQVVRVAGVLRRLTDAEWDVVVRLVEHGEASTDAVMLGRACDALADAAEIVGREGKCPSGNSGKVSMPQQGRRVRNDE